MSATRIAARGILSQRLAAAGGPAAAAAAQTLSSSSSTSTCSITASSSSQTSCSRQQQQRQQQPFQCRQLHTTSSHAARRRSPFKNVKATEMGLVFEEGVDKMVEYRKMFPKYTKDEIKTLAKRYTPEQIQAIKAADDAVAAQDLAEQGELRADTYKIDYIDDFKDYQPIIDKRPRKNSPPDHSARFMNLDEFTQDLIEWADQFRQGEPTGNMKKLADFAPEEYRNLPEREWPANVMKEADIRFKAFLREQADMNRRDVQSGRRNEADEAFQITDGDILSYILERSSFTDGNLKGNSFMAHALPSKVPGVAGMYKSNNIEESGLDDEGTWQDLKKRTGMSVRDILSIRTRTIVTRTVSNQTRMGKIRSWSVMIAAGNQNGWLGLGTAKSTEPLLAIQKAKNAAISSMQPIRRYEERTIYGTVEKKVGAAIVRLEARPPGFGLRVSHRIFEMCRLVGIHDLAAKFMRSHNPMNTVKATFKALTEQPDPEEIAIARGKKMVDVRKVYFGGRVY